MIKRKYGYHKAMHCEHCQHCIKKAKAEDFETRKSYVETSRANKYLSGMTIEQAEESIARTYSNDKWCMYSRDIPTSTKHFEYWNKQYKKNKHTFSYKVRENKEK